MGKNVDETAEQRSRRKEKEKITKNVKTNTSTKKQKEDETPEERERRKQKKEQRKKEEQSQALKEKKEANQQQQQRRIATAQQQLNIAQKGKNDDYLAGMDLPSSSEDEDFDEKIERDLTKNAFDGPSDKEAMKARKKEIEMARKEAQMKEDAMKDDDDAFNVRLPAMDEQAMAQMANSRDIKIDNFSVSVRGKPLLTDTNLTIAHGRKYGIVGPNGTGKTTLMKLMARRKIPVPDFIDILLVEQEVVGDEHTALESVVAADVELAELRTKKMELEQLMEKMAQADENKNEDLIKELNKLSFKDEETGNDMDVAQALSATYDKLKQKGDDTAEARASKILHGLGFTVVKKGELKGPDRFSMHNSTKSFSGGWRMRISLARALFIEPTCLLLDEPTNHLDLRAVIWLEEYLMRWKKTLIVVSHDRDFLNGVTTDIIHLHDHQLDQYKGNFESFEEMYVQRRTEANKVFEKYEKNLKLAKKESNKKKQEDITAKAKKDSMKKNEKKKNKGMMDDADDSLNTARAPTKWNDYDVEFHFPEPTLLNPPLISLQECSFRYAGLEGFSLDNIDLGIDMGTRVAIIGPNGAGKSTLMNLLAGDLDPTEGESRRSHSLRIGRYSQHFVDVLAMDETPVSYLQRKYKTSDGGSYKDHEIRAKLGKFGLPGHNHLQPIVKLSGGQKARVVFTAIALSNPHILLMDEPTNHLDMQSIDALADALTAFEGGVVLITHDAHICSKVLDEETSEIWVVDDGVVTKFNGGFEDYREQLVAEIAAELDGPNESAAAATPQLVASSS
jgi:ATP-binding cassette, subfamily F, member 1